MKKTAFTIFLTWLLFHWMPNIQPALSTDDLFPIFKDGRQLHPSVDLREVVGTHFSPVWTVCRYASGLHIYNRFKFNRLRNGAREIIDYYLLGGDVDSFYCDPGGAQIQIDLANDRSIIQRRHGSVSLIALLPNQPSCTPDVDDLPPGSLPVYQLTRINGDCEMAGHNPTLSIEATLTCARNEITVTGFVEITESEPDFSTFHSSIDWTRRLPVAGIRTCADLAGAQATGRVAANSGSNNHEWTEYPGEGAIRSAKCLTDTRGGDCGRLGCIIQLNLSSRSQSHSDNEPTLLSEETKRRLHVLGQTIDERWESLPIIMHDDKPYHPLNGVIDNVELIRNDLPQTLSSTDFAALRDYLDDAIEEKITQARSSAVRAGLVNQSDAPAQLWKGLEHAHMSLMAAPSQNGEGIIAKSISETIRAGLKSLLEKVLTLPSLTVDLVIESRPTGAAFAMYPRSYKLGTRDTITNDSIRNIYRGKYLYAVSRQGYEKVEGELNLVDDEGTRIICFLDYTDGERGCLLR